MCEIRSIAAFVWIAYTTETPMSQILVSTIHLLSLQQRIRHRMRPTDRLHDLWHGSNNEAAETDAKRFGEYEDKRRS